MRGFILHMWTGVFEGDDGLPMFFHTKKAALRHIARCPSWGRAAVTVYACTVKGTDYIVGNAVANGLEA